MARKWTSEEDQWLRDNFNLAKTWTGFLAAFNYHFYPEVRTMDSLRSRCRNGLGLKSLKDPRKFTPEEDQFLKDNITKVSTLKELTEVFNQHFHTQRCTFSISDRCSKQLKLHISELNPNRSTGQFSKGSQVRTLPLGTIKESQVGTYIKVKAIPPNAHISGYQRPYWLPYQEYVYRQYTNDQFTIDNTLFHPQELWDQTTFSYRQLPLMKDGEMICFLNNNRKDFRIENLYPINRSISAMMSANEWWSTNREITLTAILACQLYFAMKGKEV